MKLLNRSIIVLSLLIFMCWIYTNSLIGVNHNMKKSYATLKQTLEEKGYKARLFVISGKRYQLDNWILTQLSGAAFNSQHLKGKAIDFIVLDINQDGKIDANDVDLVYEILDQEIIGNKGGVGTYKNEQGFFNRQMIHMDMRGKRTRWRR